MTVSVGFFLYTDNRRCGRNWKRYVLEAGFGICVQVRWWYYEKNEITLFGGNIGCMYQRMRQHEGKRRAGIADRAYGGRDGRNIRGEDRDAGVSHRRYYWRTELWDTVGWLGRSFFCLPVSHGWKRKAGICPGQGWRDCLHLPGTGRGRREWICGSGRGGVSGLQ